MASGTGTLRVAAPSSKGAILFFIPSIRLVPAPATHLQRYCLSTSKPRQKKHNGRLWIEDSTSVPIATSSQLKPARIHVPKSAPIDRASPFSTPSSSSLASPSVSAFDRRLQFLSGIRVSPASSLQLTDESQESEGLTDPSTFTASRKKAPKSGKKYWPGFQPGDFICPQCGSHNFRPPERTASKKQQRAEAAAAAKSASKSASYQEAPSSSSPSKPLIPQYKYPLGALAHCFECGFDTTYDPSFSPSTSSTTSSSLSPPPLPPPPQETIDANTTTESPRHFRSDLRLVKPRDYICPQCQTVNYNNRLYCVGCGSIAPWIRNMVKDGSGHKKISK